MRTITEFELENCIEKDIIRTPTLRVAGIDQGRSGLYVIVLDIYSEDTEYEVVQRHLYSAKHLHHSDLIKYLNDENVNIGCFDNEPDRNLAYHLTNEYEGLHLIDSRSRLDFPIMDSTIFESGKRLPCKLIQSEFFRKQAFENFFRNGYGATGIKIPESFNTHNYRQDISSPLHHFMSIGFEEESNKFHKIIPNDNFFDALVYAESALYMATRYNKHFEK